MLSSANVRNAGSLYEVFPEDKAPPKELTVDEARERFPGALQPKDAASEGRRGRGQREAHESGDSYREPSRDTGPASSRASLERNQARPHSPLSPSQLKIIRRPERRGSGMGRLFRLLLYVYANGMD